MTERPPWEFDEEEQACPSCGMTSLPPHLLAEHVSQCRRADKATARAATAVARALSANATPTLASKLSGLSAAEGEVWDALVRQACAEGATEEQRRAFYAAKAQVLATGRLSLPKPRENEVSVPREVREAVDFLLAIGCPPKDAERVARDELESTPALAAAEAMREAGWRMLVLSGERGTGKSIAGQWWLLRVPHQRSGSVVRTTPRRFVEADVLHRMPEDELHGVAMAVALVVDDVGVPASDIDDRTIATLLTRRYRSGLSTIVTTNLSADDFAARYGDRVYDRVCEVGKWMSVGTESLRRR